VTHPDPLRHLTRAAELATVADRKISDGIYEGGDTAFTQTVIDLARLHVQIAGAAAALVPVQLVIDPLAEQQKRGEL
jgi:hypothetical protein